jgi:DNA polymerase-1
VTSAAANLYVGSSARERIAGWTLETTIVTTEAQLRGMVERLSGLPLIAYDSETSGLNPHLGARICGHGLAGLVGSKRVEAFYIPIRHLEVGTTLFAQWTQLEAERAAVATGEVLKSPGTCTLHHAKFDLSMLRADDVAVTRDVVDTLILATAHDENERSFSLKALAAKYCVKTARTEEGQLTDWMKADARKLGIPFEKQRRGEGLEVLSEPTYLERFGYARTPIDLCAKYAGKDLFYTLFLYDKFGAVGAKYADLVKREHEVMRCCLHEMEWNGLPVDVAKIRDAHDNTAKEITHWLKFCRETIGDGDFEGTDAELRQLFYDKLGMEAERFTKGGKNDLEGMPSVDKIARKLLATKYPTHEPLVNAIDSLLRARKLHSTYAGSFLRLTTQDGRIHPTYNQIEQRDEGGVPVTGRLSSSSPNAQNIDSKSVDLVATNSKLFVREFFVVPKGFVRFYIDFNQIELRVLTWFCQDRVLLEAYRTGADIHAITANMLGIDRKTAKIVNFGSSYGFSEKGLAVKLPGFYEDPVATEARAKIVLRDFFDRYRAIREFKCSIADQVRQNDGLYVSPFGRPRRIPNLLSDKPWERDRAERQLMSSVVSGTAADVMKESMIRCSKILNCELPCKGWLVQSIHDELVFDVRYRPGWSRTLVDLVRAMEDWPMFSERQGTRAGVPIKVNATVAFRSWGNKQPVTITADGRLEGALDPLS